MKLVQLIRYLFQVMVLVAVFCLIGSIGAWETGSINFPQLLLQLILFCRIYLVTRPPSVKMTCPVI